MVQFGWNEEPGGDSRSRGSFQAGWGDGGETIPYRVDDANLKELQDRITDVLGDVDPVKSDGRLRRTMPAAHPRFPYWVAQGVVGGVGMGKFTATDAPANLGVPPIPGSPLYKTYVYSIHFGAVPYAILPNENIQLYHVDGWDEFGEPDVFTFPNEWERYTVWGYQRSDDYVSAQQGGGMVFRDGFPRVSGTPFTGMPRMYLRNQILKMQWYRIPERYMSSPNSYLASLQGTINQQDFYNWAAGSLLYLGADTLQRQTPPVAGLGPWGQKNQATHKVVDVELTWLRTTRFPARIPDTPPVNPGWLVAGHNLLPNVFSRQFHYATVNDPDPAKQAPLFTSAAHGLLFMDPDVPQ